MSLRAVLSRTASALLLSSSSALAADAPAWTHDVVYTADIIGPVRGAPKSGRYLDNLDLTLDGDLEKAIGWKGASVHAYVLNNMGGKPNDVAGTLQGVDNIEVSRARVRLYELWVQQDLADGAASVRVGLYDLNSEFYTTDASGLLIAPAFGIGSELSASGPNGPSIFPLTSVAVRVKVGRDEGPYAQAAVLSAQAGAFNEPSNLQLGLDRGAILIAEAGHAGPVRIAAGAWTYTQRQDDLRDLTPTGDPARSNAHGGYVLAEGRLWGEDDGVRRGSAFARGGVSDGDTTPFRGGWQAGVKIDHVFEGRPDSSLSFGVNQGLLSRKFRDNGRDAGLDLGRAESAAEITYSDTIGRLSIQPDLQIVRHPGGERDRRTVVIAGVRFTVDLD